MKTAKAVIEKSVWALVLGLGLVLAAQAQPADSTGAGRVISSQGTISSSSGTTGTYTPAPPQPPQSQGPFANSRYQPWTLAFQGQEKCMFVAWSGRNNDLSLCARITNDGTGNAELYQPAGRMGNDMRPDGWFQSAFPQYARQWPNWPVAPATEAVALKTITFYNQGSVQSCVGGRNQTCTTVAGASISISPILGPSGLASDWSFSYYGQNCVAVSPSYGAHWTNGCTLPYVAPVIDYWNI